MIESKAVNELGGIMSYADALRDIHLMTDDNHAKVIRDFYDARALIIQALMQYEAGKK